MEIDQLIVFEIIGGDLPVICMLYASLYTGFICFSDIRRGVEDCGQVGRTFG